MDDKWDWIVEFESTSDASQVFTYRLPVPGGWIYRVGNMLCYVPDPEEWADIFGK